MYVKTALVACCIVCVRSVNQAMPSLSDDWGISRHARNTLWSYNNQSDAQRTYLLSAQTGNAAFNAYSPVRTEVLSALPQNYAQPQWNLMTIDQWEEFERLMDRREEEGWWHLYPFGARYNDADIGSRPYYDAQIDFGFDYPFYGFWFNYTIIYPNGLIAFSVPEFIQPPYTFPNPRWPDRKDASFIAPFYTEQVYQHVGEKRISHVWYRTVHRPKIDERHVFNDFRELTGHELQQHWGNVEDPLLLDSLTRDIQEGIIGANGFRAEHALIVTWERMAYGGAPKISQVDKYREVLSWQNTYQLAIVTDEVRSYVIMNYAHLNWTSSTIAGSLAGKGGMQSAIAGFNGGNGTGWTSLPYSGEGRIHKLDYFSNVGVPGRWVYRVDEEIIPGGCSNESTGVLYTSPLGATMLGGTTVNVSGPCFRPGDFIRVIFDDNELDCPKVSTHRVRCVLPIDEFYTTGIINVRLSRDGGVSYPYQGSFYVLQPSLAEPQIKLIDDAKLVDNNWRSINASQLTLQWGANNLTVNSNALVDITLWGYWEDTDDSLFTQVGVIAEGVANTGRYSFNPKTLANKNEHMEEAWKKFGFGAIRISLTEIEGDETLHGVFWSKLTPFGWYFVERWEEEYDHDWALHKCKQWFDYDGQRLNFAMDLETHAPCPCTLDQALLDFGRFTALFDCNMEGDTSCNFNKGSQHCVMSVQTSWSGGVQTCCYDFDGWLLHSDDYENAAYLKFYSPGVGQRGHPFGSFPLERPPRIPSLSHYMVDRMAFQYCCTWAEHCEFYYWRRQTSGCQQYRPPAAAYAFGEPHFQTFDGQRYSFQGKGYFVLAYMQDDSHDLMIQVRMEQPPKTAWGQHPQATVITGVAVQDNGSDVVQILARKEFRRFRYKTDVFVNGRRCFFDTPEFKYQQYAGVALRSPERNHNHSDILIMLGSGVGVRVLEAFGTLSIVVVLPPHFNQSHPSTVSHTETGTPLPHTMGLLGTFNGRREDDLMAPDGAISTVVYPLNGEDMRTLYNQFGSQWRIEGSEWPLLFEDGMPSIYNPTLFASQSYTPEFEITHIAPNATLAFSIEEVLAACHEHYECTYDYIMTGQREIALNTMNTMNKFEQWKERGSRIWVSCGALNKAQGAVKHPPGNNYLDGITVTFSCKPEYFLHGDQQRTCINGTWTPGWWVWCRSRTEENALKYLTGIVTILLFIVMMTCIFLCCYYRREQLNATR